MTKVSFQPARLPVTVGTDDELVLPVLVTSGDAPVDISAWTLEAESATVAIIDGAGGRFDLTFDTSPGFRAWWVRRSAPDPRLLISDVLKVNREGVSDPTGKQTISLEISTLDAVAVTLQTDAVGNGGGVPSILAGTRADQPAAGTVGRLYYVTDEDVIERDTGSAWAQVTDKVHRDAATGVHGVGASTVESASGAQAKVDAHANLTTNPHAVTAAQADAVALAGDTMTGALTLPGAPTADLHAATKAYVDTISGGTP